MTMRAEVKRHPGGTVTINVMTTDGVLVVGSYFTRDGILSNGTRGVSVEWAEAGTPEEAERRSREWLRSVGAACLEAAEMPIPNTVEE